MLAGMSIFTYIIDSDWRQRRDLERAKAETSALSSALDATGDDLVALRRRVTELNATVGILVQMLVERGGLDAGDFQARIAALSPKAHPQPCSKCGQRKPDGEMLKVGADWWCATCARNP